MFIDNECKRDYLYNKTLENRERFTLFEKIRQIISDQFETDEEYITLKTQFEEDLDADYIDMIDLAMTLEDEFSVEVPDEALEKFKTVADVVEFLD